MNQLIKLIDEKIFLLKGLTNTEAIDKLLSIKVTNDTDRLISAIMYDYLTSPILSDKELLWKIEKHRNGSLPSMNIDLSEVDYLMKAWRSQQYHRFMCHAIDRYIDDKDVYMVSGTDNMECCICWRSIYGKDKADSILNTGFSSRKPTSTSICPHCLLQLKVTSYILEKFNDRDYMYLINRLK